MYYLIASIIIFITLLIVERVITLILRKVEEVRFINDKENSFGSLFDDSYRPHWRSHWLKKIAMVLLFISVIGMITVSVPMFSDRFDMSLEAEVGTDFFVLLFYSFTIGSVVNGIALFLLVDQPRINNINGENNLLN